MPQALHIQEDELIQYAMGTLSDIQLNNLTAHISMCGVCRAELAKNQLALASFSATMPLEEVPSGARERFFAKIHSDDAPASRFENMRSRSPIIDKLTRFKEWLESPLPIRVVAGVLAAVLVYMVFDDVSHIREIRYLLGQSARFQADAARLTEIETFLRGSDSKQVSLYTKPQSNKDPIGHVLYDSRVGKLIFTVQNMPVAPVGKKYELWVLPATGSAPLPAGLFSPDPQGNGAIIFPPLPPNVQALGFGVTVENEAGSATPTMPIVLTGQ
jgi:hypothetical protein